MLARTRLTIWTLILSWLITLPVAAAEHELKLDPAGTIIVTPDNYGSTLRMAVNTLSQWLKAACRAENGFDVIPESKVSTDEDRTILAVGTHRWSVDPRIAALQTDGFVLRRIDNVIMMAGKSEQSALSAAVEFLDRCIGVRFYMPTALFTSLPEQSTFTIGQLDVVSNPFVPSLYLSGIDSDDQEGARWTMRNGGWRRKGGTHQHNLFSIFEPKRFAHRYPEIYPIIEGKRYIPTGKTDQSWQINFLAPAAVDAAMESIREYFEKRPEDEYIAVSINDGGRNDETPETLAVVQSFEHRYPNERFAKAMAYSSIYWKFMAELGQRMKSELPGKNLLGLAYGATRFAPEHALPDNVVVFTNFHVAELPQDRFIEPQADQPGSLELWARVARHYGNHDWYQGSGFIIPRAYTNHWRQFLAAVDHHFDGPYMHVECYPNWGLDGFKYYFMAKLMWDPKADIDGLRAQMAKDLYGPAAAPMRRYMETTEKLWVQLNVTEGVERKLFRWAAQFGTTEEGMRLVELCHASLQEAAALAETDEQKKRVALFKDFFTIPYTLFHIMNSEEPLDEQQYQNLLALAEDLPNRHPLLAQHKHLIPRAVKGVCSEKRKRTMAPVSVPAISSPVIDGKGNEASWSNALQHQPFVNAHTNTADEQKTTLSIGADSDHLYLLVHCPRVHQREFIETDDSNWRSDNVEVMFDLDGDIESIERKMWVKTNGRIVDHTGRKQEKPVNIKAAVIKSADHYVMEIAIPRSWLADARNPGKVGIFVRRNEFTLVDGANRDTYAAIWNKRLTLPKP